MKRLLVALALLSTLAGCTSSTAYGPCVGAFDEKDPHLVYKVNSTNVAIGVIFVEMIVPPIKVVVDETLCPIGRK